MVLESPHPTLKHSPKCFTMNQVQEQNPDLNIMEPLMIQKQPPSQRPCQDVQK